MHKHMMGLIILGLYPCTDGRPISFLVGETGKLVFVHHTQTRKFTIVKCNKKKIRCADRKELIVGDTC